MQQQNLNNFFKFEAFSQRQMQALTWYLDGSGVNNNNKIIASGSIRSGKTLAMSLSFVLWAMSNFNFQNFICAGKTIEVFKKNVWRNLELMLIGRGFFTQLRRKDNIITVSKGNIVNYFYIYGGKDEASQDLVQGLTAAGAYLDEVVLMPESFVNQVIARCSVHNARIWMTCNPNNPNHYVKKNFVDDSLNKKVFELKFTMDDNPSLTQETKDNLTQTFTGVYYNRYIKGEWASSEGLVYSNFCNDYVIQNIPKNVNINKTFIGVDYGHVNPTTFLAVGLGSDDRLYVYKEYYHAGLNSPQKTAREYAEDFKKFLVTNLSSSSIMSFEGIYVDPSASAFILELYQILKTMGLRGVNKANNDVTRGIELISILISLGKVRVLASCKHTIDEFYSYMWDSVAANSGIDRPIKSNDHCLDALRYVILSTRQKWKYILEENFYGRSG